MKEIDNVEDISSGKLLKPKEPVKKEEEPKPEHVCKFTIDGEVLVETYIIDGKRQYKYHPLKTAYLLPIPAWLNERYIQQIEIMHAMITDIKEQTPDRSVPLTYDELLAGGVDRKKVGKLIKSGYLRITDVNLLNSKGDGVMDKRVIYYTPQGRALVREHIDPNYAKTENIA